MTTLKDSAPKTVGEVRKLLGLMGYYRRYIPNFARTARLLFDLLQGPSSEKAKSTTETGKKAGLIPSSKPVLWHEQHKDALAELCDRITSPPIMEYPDYNYPFVLHTYASLDGLGAVVPETKWKDARHGIWIQVSQSS